ncbi:TPA: queuosine precursor transporter [Legionella pneumophila]
MNNNSRKHISQYPRYLWFLILAYSMTLAMSNWYDSRIVQVFGISVTPGSLVYSITYLLSNVITEVYGFKNARKAIWTALLFNVIFILYGWLVMILPTPATIDYDSSFDNFLATNARIVMASFVSYLISEPVNALIIAKLKVLFKGKYLGIRFILSTLTSGVIDSILFILIAFYQVIPDSEIIKLIAHIWMVKTIVELIGLPLSIAVCKKLKKSEKLDVYDTFTDFTMFSLNSVYLETENKFGGNLNKNTSLEDK